MGGAGRTHEDEAGPPCPPSPRALAVLAEAEALRDGSGLLFPSASGKPLSDMTLSKLVKELGFDADVHGFRTSFRVWAQERTDFPGEVAEMARAHVNKDRVEAAYARSDLFEKRREMMEALGSLSHHSAKRRVQLAEH